MIEALTERLLEALTERLPTPIDHLEAELAAMEPCVFPVEHTFTPGIYVRKTTLPKGSMLTSMRHKTEHQFIILQGDVEVRSDFESIRYQGPCHGVTLPGTKRVLYAHTDTVWLTIHANPDDIRDMEELAEKIIEPNTNPLLPADHPRLNGWRETTNHLEETK